MKRGPKPKSENRNNEMKTLRFDHGWSYQEIGDKFGVSKQRVGQIVGSSGFTSRRGLKELTKKAERYVTNNPHLYTSEIADLSGLESAFLGDVRKRIAGTNRVDKAKRFWLFVDKKGKDECWEWTAGRHPIVDYGRYRYQGLAQYTHRVSWQITNGNIPEGKQVLHHCDNRICVNPNHLYLGSSMDNANDRGERSRFVVRALSIEKAAQIKQMHRDGVGLEELSALFSVTKQSIDKVLKGITYQQA